MSRVLIAGGASIVGRDMARRLAAAGHDVHVTFHNSQVPWPAGIVPYRVNLLDATASARVVDTVHADWLMACAWVGSGGAYATDPQNAAWQQATLTLADRFFAAGGRRLVFAGSCAEYDWTDPCLARGPVGEDQAGGTPQSIYGQCKRATGAGLQARAAAAGATAAVGRIFLPIGLHDHPKRFAPYIISSLLAGQPAKLGPCTAIRDFIDYRDVAGALCLLLETGAQGIFNVGTGRPTRLADVAMRIASMMDRSHLLEIGSLPAREGDPETLVADMRKISRVGFKPEYSLEETLRTMISAAGASAALSTEFREP